MSFYDVIVVGGGAAGLLAAGKSAQMGARTLLLEKMDKPGRKILISGKGRCNLTNTADIEDFIKHYGKNGSFLRQAYYRFFTPDLIAFFDEMGLTTIEERGGRVFPKSGLAQDVIDALVRWNITTGSEIRSNSQVNQIIPSEGSVFSVKSNQTKFSANTIIITTGGASYPGTGSTGDGYRFAETMGHTIVPIRPALVPLITKGNEAQKCQGLSLKNVSVSVYINQEKIDTGFGEMLFTHFGISGPIILTLSGKIVDALRLKQHVEISINLKPGLDETMLDARLRRDIDSNGKKQYKSLLKGLLPVKLIPVCIEQTGIPESKVCHQITSSERDKLRNWLKDFRLIVTGHRNFRQAIVTAGGVNLREINPRTMESLIYNGLFFAGEVLDIDADTGGYNLQAAFSTGWLAGFSAAKLVKEIRGKV